MPEERFAFDWLALREPVDHAARDDAFIAPLRTVWRTRGWSRVLDLGSGAGSNFRYLAPRLPGPQRWTLLDHDRDLLDRAGADVHDTAAVTCVEGDLAVEGLARIDDAELVTASALLDLVTEAWTVRMVERCVRAGAGALFALTYDGCVTWSDGGREADELVRRAVNAHQRGDKGLGPALGPDAGHRVAALFREAGYRVWTTATPWRLGAWRAPAGARSEALADDLPSPGLDSTSPGPGSVYPHPSAISAVSTTALALALVDGWVAAAREARPDREEEIGRWADRRKGELAGATVGVEVGHVDVLALPTERS